MLIHNLPQTLSDDGRSIYLPDYTRAPLGLVEGSEVYCAFRNQTRLHDRGLFITPYRPDCWQDLWRMEIQFRDEVGQFHRLMEIFDEHRVHVLHAASRASFKSSFHVKYFMLDCTRYNSDIDGTSATRFANSIDDLVGLRYLLQLEFISSIRLLDDGRPRLRISRNLVHLNMAQDRLEPELDHDEQNHNRLAHVEGPISIERGRVAIPNKTLTLLGPDDGARHIVVTTNAKAHVIYCTFNQADPRQGCHVFFHFDGDPAAGKKRWLSHITRIISEHRLNVVRCQVRQGLLPNRRGLRTGLEITKTWAQPYTLNLFIEADGARNIRGKTIMQKLREIFQKDEGQILLFECKPRNLAKIVANRPHDE